MPQCFATPLLLVAACAVPPSPAAPGSAGDEATASGPAPVLERAASVTNKEQPPLDAHQRALLQRWFAAVGPARPGESLGSLIVRAGLLQLGRAYGRRADEGDGEHLRIELDTFQCVSFVESTLAVARCTLRGTPSERCFRDDVRAWRYRGGRIDGYASRLHYFTDWIDDNTARGRLRSLAAVVPTRPVVQRFSYMSDHPGAYPTLDTDDERMQIATVEARLSGERVQIIDRAHIRAAEAELEDGDLVAFAGDKPGILITHAGFIHRAADGVPRVLHASSYHHHVLLGSGVADYVLRKPNRRGIIVARPVPPALEPPGAAR